MEKFPDSFCYVVEAGRLAAAAAAAPVQALWGHLGPSVSQGRPEAAAWPGCGGSQRLAGSAWCQGHGGCTHGLCPETAPGWWRLAGPARHREGAQHLVTAHSTARVAGRAPVVGHGRSVPSFQVHAMD